MGARPVAAGDGGFLFLRPEEPAGGKLLLAAAPFYKTSIFYMVCAAVLLLAGYGVYHWLARWRRRRRKERDEELFRLIDEWTKNLQQEVAERKQAQKALVESQEIVLRQERLAAVGQMAAGWRMSSTTS